MKILIDIGLIGLKKILLLCMIDLGSNVNPIGYRIGILGVAAVANLQVGKNAVFGLLQTCRDKKTLFLGCCKPAGT